MAKEIKMKIIRVNKPMQDEHTKPGEVQYFDVQQALTTMLERDICKSAIDGIINKLNKI